MDEGTTYQVGAWFPVGTGNFCRKCVKLALGVGLDFPGVRVTWSVWWAVEKGSLAVACNLTRDVCPRYASFYEKILQIFYYLLYRAHSIFINIISIILYFTFYFLLFVNCTLFLFFSCVCAKKCDVGCIFYSVFLLPLFISQNPIAILLYFLHFSTASLCKA